jgi:hypothetical protein
MIKILMVMLSILLFYSGNDWKLRKDKSGIQVFTRLPEDSDFDEFKAVVTIEGSTLYQVLEVVLDVENFEALYPDCMNPEILKKEGKWPDIHYIQTKAPFPLKDRDSIFETLIEIDENEKNAQVRLTPVPDFIPEKDGLVRIQNGRGFWKLEENDNKVIVIYQFHGDPGGDVPAWLVNSFVVSHPFKTMENLREIVKSNLKTNKY